MATFTAFNAAGIGFNMSTTSSTGWTFLRADPAIMIDLASDNGATAIYDVYGSSQIDDFKIRYETNGYDIIVRDLLYKNNGEAILTISGLDLETTIDDIEGNAWFVMLNGGDDTFNGNDFDDVIRAGYGDDLVYAYDGDDIVYGDAGEDDLYGLLGDDDLYGGTGRDYLSGGAGSDYLSGGADSDTLVGGAGNDYFAFDTRPKAGKVDRITDFRPVDDTIMLDNAVFTRVGKDGWLSGAAFTIGSKARDASDRIIYQKNTGALYYDPDGTGSSPAVKFAQLKAGLALTKADFYII